MAIYLNDILHLDDLENTKIRLVKSHPDNAIWNPMLWLLFHIGRVTRNLDVFNGVGYEYEILPNYEQYFGRVIVRYHNIHQQLVRWADALIGELEVYKILPDIFNNDTFPGYEWVNLSWQELSSVIALV